MRSGPLFQTEVPVGEGQEKTNPLVTWRLRSPVDPRGPTGLLKLTSRPDKAPFHARSSSKNRLDSVEAWARLPIYYISDGQRYPSALRRHDTCRNAAEVNDGGKLDRPNAVALLSQFFSDAFERQPGS